MARLAKRRGKSLGAIDKHVAARLRQRRLALGMSQRKLGVALGLTFQLVHKYEQGQNRISAGRLLEFSKVLDVPIEFFFEGVADTSMHAAPLVSAGDQDPLAVRKATELVAAYRGISNPAVRRGLRQLAKALGPKPHGSTGAKPVPSQSRRASRRVRTDRGGGAAKR